MIRTYKGPNPTISDEQKNNILATKEDDAENLDPQEETKVNENTTPAQAELLAALDAG